MRESIPHIPHRENAHTPKPNLESKIFKESQVSVRIMMVKKNKGKSDISNFRPMTTNILIKYT